MDTKKRAGLVSRVALPAGVILCGLVLLLRPDTATAMVSKLFGWALTLWGGCCLCLAVLGSADRGKNALTGIGLLTVGRWLRRSPLALAAGMGRLLGIGLAVGCLGGLLRTRSGPGRALQLAGVAAGLILALLPMTFSRLLYTLCGAVVTAVGVILLLRRLSDRGDDPGIIDAL